MRYLFVLNKIALNRNAKHSVQENTKLREVDGDKDLKQQNNKNHTSENYISLVRPYMLKCFTGQLLSYNVNKNLLLDPDSLLLYSCTKLIKIYCHTKIFF